MTVVTVIDERPITVDAVVTADTVLLTPSQVESALGWKVTPQGLCRDDVCVPVGAVVGGDTALLDLAEVAAALGRPLVLDAAAGIAALARPAEARRRALRELVVPDLELPDLDGRRRRLSEWEGRKRLLVAVATWCGCCYDLPGWQALHDELAPNGFCVVAVFLDADPEVVRPFAAGLSVPVLHDPDRVIPEVLAVSNVPTAVWIDEEGRIARPPGTAHGTDLFAEVTGIRAEPHLEAVRRWVRHGTVPLTREEAAAAVADLTEDEIRARLHFRIAAEARRRGDDEATRRHADLAGRLAPDDLAVWRAAMPLVGEDPFGEGFLERFDAWRARGSPAHELPPMSAVPDGSS